MAVSRLRPTAPEAGYTLPTEYTVYDGAGLFGTYTGSTAGITKVWDIRYDLPGTYELYTVPDPDAPFTDVRKTDYFYEPVKWAVSSGVTKGATATTFAPNATCTRQQVVTFLYRACGSPAVSGSNPFSDVKSTDYSYNAILWAVANGITKGTTDTTFSPTDTCTSAHVLTFLYRAKGSPAVSGAVGSHYYDAAAQWAREIGLYDGLPFGFVAGRKAPRAEIVTYLYGTRNIAAAESKPAPSAAVLPDGRYDVSFRRDGLTGGKSGESILVDVVEYLGLSAKEAAALSRGQVFSFSKLVPGTPDIKVSTWKTQGNTLTINGEHEFWLNKDLDDGAGRYVYIDPEDPNGPGLTYATKKDVRLSVASGAKIEDWTSASLKSRSSVSEFFAAFPVDSWIGHVEVSGGSITLASFDYRP